MGVPANPASSETPGFRSVPRTLDRYVLVHEIASGGMATVFLARERAKGLGSWLAVKCCHPHLQHIDEFSTMFRDEVRLAARVRHPNVVETIDGGLAADGTLFMVMRFVNGFTLGQILSASADRHVPVPPPIARRIVSDVLRGLDAAHELRDDEGRYLQIVHRDVSPPNILVGLDGVSRIADFGIAKAASQRAVTREGRIKGKLAYMAPEQHGLIASIATHPLTRQTDVFAAGVVLWELLAGEPLFLRSTDGETVKQLARSAPRPPSSVAGTSPSALDDVVLRALERDPHRRFESASAFADALDSCEGSMADVWAVGAFVRRTLTDAVDDRTRLLASLECQRWSLVPRPAMGVNDLALRRFSIPAPSEKSPSPRSNPRHTASAASTGAMIAAVLVLGAALATVARSMHREPRTFEASWVPVASVRAAVRTSATAATLGPSRSTHSEARHSFASVRDREQIGAVKKPTPASANQGARRVLRRAKH